MPHTHHQLCEHDVQLLGGRHGEWGLQGHHTVNVIMAVSDLGLVVSLEATREQTRQAPPSVLLFPRNHGNPALLPKHRGGIFLHYGLCHVTSLS